MKTNHTGKRTPGHGSLVLAALLGLTVAVAASAAPMKVDLTAEAAVSVPNDVFRVTVFAEGTGTTVGEVAKRNSEIVTAAIKAIKEEAAVKTVGQNAHTYPIYAKGGKVEGWRMRTELVLESSATASLAALVGRLQNSMGVARLSMQPSPEARTNAENQAILKSIAAFKERARVISNDFAKPYRINQLSVSVGGEQSMPMQRAVAPMMISADSGALPVESGETRLTAVVTGQIEVETTGLSVQTGSE